MREFPIQKRSTYLRTPSYSQAEPLQQHTHSFQEEKQAPRQQCHFHIDDHGHNPHEQLFLKPGLSVRFPRQQICHVHLSRVGDSVISNSIWTVVPYEVK